MIDHYGVGAVWWLLIDFGKGRGLQEKFIVLLSDVPESERGVFAFATSQGKWYSGMSTSPCGCPKNSCYRVDPGQEVCFSQTTYIQFNNAHPITRAGLGDQMKLGSARFVQTLSDNRVRSLLKCALQSLDLSGDDVELIKTAFAALTPPPTTAAKKVVAVAPPAAYVPPEILHLRVRVNARCSTCQTSLAGMVHVDFLSIMAGSKPLPPSFVGDVDAGLDLLSDCACAKKK